MSTPNSTRVTIDATLTTRREHSYATRREITVHRAELGDAFTGEGRTAAEAKADLAATLTSYAAAFQRPVVISYRGRTIVAYVAPHAGAHEWWTQTYDERGRTTSSPSGYGALTATEVTAKLALQVAKTVTSYHDADDVLTVAGWLAETAPEPAVPGDRAPVADFLADAGFQRAYLHADAHGIEDPFTWAQENRLAHTPAHTPAAA